MPAPQRFLGEQAQTVETRAVGMAKPLERWLRRMARAAADAEIAAIANNTGRGILFGKQEPPDFPELVQQLRDILTRFGIAQMAAATATGAATVGASVSLSEEMILEFLEQKEIKLQQIIQTTLGDVQASVRQIVADALLETPRPTTTAIGRRIARQFHGSGFAPAPPAQAAGVLGTRVATTASGNLYVFSADRAQLIARTEMVQAQNTGIVNGYRLTGIRRHKWISYQDGRSGRGHDRMKGQTVELGDFFTAPDGTKLRYPGDPSAPIRHTANCRCTTVPVISDSEA